MVGRKPRSPTPYHINSARRIFDDAKHQLRGLAVDYCYDRAPGSDRAGKAPLDTDTRWTDEVEAEFARVYEAVLHMVKDLQEKARVTP